MEQETKLDLLGAPGPRRRPQAEKLLSYIGAGDPRPKGETHTRPALRVDAELAAAVRRLTR